MNYWNKLKSAVLSPDSWYVEPTDKWWKWKAGVNYRIPTRGTFSRNKIQYKRNGSVRNMPQYKRQRLSLGYAGAGSAKNRYYRKRRPNRKRTRKSKLRASRIAAMSSPPKIMKSCGAWNHDNDGLNRVLFLATPLDSLLQPGGTQRYIAIGEALTNQTVSTVFDDEYTFNWIRSTTRLTAHNPNNFLLKFTYWEMQFTKNVIQMPLGLANVGLGSAEYIVTAGVSAAPTSQYTAAAVTQGMLDTLSTDIPVWPSDFGSAFKTHVDIWKKRSGVIPPGGYASFTRRNRPGIIKGDDLDDSATGTQIKSIMQMWRFEPPFMNTSEAAIQAEVLQVGFPIFNISWELRTMDTFSEFEQSKTERFRVTGAEEALLIDPATAGTLTVTSTVGAANVPNDPS